METQIFSTLSEYWWFYAAFTAFVFAMLALDLGVFHKHAHEVKFKEAAGMECCWGNYSTGL